MTLGVLRRREAPRRGAPRGWGANEKIMRSLEVGFTEQPLDETGSKRKGNPGGSNTWSHGSEFLGF